MQVDFYQLGDRPIEKVLPRIAERVLEGGGRLLVVAGDEGLAARLDEQLWSYAPESFLPHGRAGKGNEAEQPVLISCTLDPANRARAIALADGVWREEALGFDRALPLLRRRDAPRRARGVEGAGGKGKRGAELLAA